MALPGGANRIAGWPARHHGCRARRLASSVGTRRLVLLPLKPLRLANRRGMTDSL